VHLEELAQADRIDWDRPRWTPPRCRSGEPGKNPMDRGKQGTKRHLVVDAIEPIRAKTRGRPRADRVRHLRLALRKRRIILRIARCGVEPKKRLGRYLPAFHRLTTSGARERSAWAARTAAAILGT
jgi:hypothetical protein